MTRKNHKQCLRILNSHRLIFSSVAWYFYDFLKKLCFIFSLRFFKEGFKLCFLIIIVENHQFFLLWFWFLSINLILQTLFLFSQHVIGGLVKCNFGRIVILEWCNLSPRIISMSCEMYCLYYNKLPCWEMCHLHVLIGNIYNRSHM